MSLYVLLFLLFSSAKATIPDSLLISQLIKEIEHEQMEPQGQFLDGMFYSFRKFAGYPQKTSPDENVFFTTLLSFALKNILPHLNANNRETGQKIIDRAATSYPHFQNKDKLPIYFFWHKGYPVMPHSNIISRTGKKLAVSEDQDDTVMIFMTSNQGDSATLLLKNLMDAASNGQRKFTKTTYNRFRKLPAHTTYFGKNMLSDFDFAVHCNILYFLLEKGLPFNRIDSATLHIVQQMISNRTYVTDPTYISPYYVHTPILIYHIARLMGKFTIPELEPYKAQLIKDILAEMGKSTNIMTDIILSTSLLRLGANAPRLPLESLEQFKRSNQDQFVFYQARAAILFPNPLKRIFLDFSMLQYHYFCPAYNKALLLEYLVERNKRI
jgi:hypothetical protein